MPSVVEQPVSDTLLRASALLNLFRNLVLTEAAEHRAALEGSIVTLLNEVTGTDGGFVLIPADGETLAQAAEARDWASLGQAVGEAALGRVVFRDGITAGPLRAREEVRGAIALLGPDCSEVLPALLTLGSSAIAEAGEFAQLRRENTLLKAAAGASASGIVGESPAVVRLRGLIARLAPQDVTVLVTGESGTGKELVARALHAQGGRAEGPFVAINCASLSDTLLESELFGHERGAFTGALAQKRGKLELAEGGVVFLDEVGEMTPSIQAKMLRVLQERVCERVGGTKAIALNIRLVAATNRDLAAESAGGRFRLDLYHRLNVVKVKTPPLRERAEDIPVLARRFLEVSTARCRRRVEGVSAEAEQCLLRYPWPGNVRELQNAIEHAVILGSSEWIIPGDLPETVLQATAPAELPSLYHATVADARKESIVQAWRDARGDNARAALMLGLHPNSLRRLIRVLGLRESLPERF